MSRIEAREVYKAKAKFSKTFTDFYKPVDACNTNVKYKADQCLVFLIPKFSGVYAEC